MLRPGGVFMDAPAEFWPTLDSFLEALPDRIDELESYLTGNEIIFARTKGVAVLTPEVAIDASISALTAGMM